MPKKRAWHHPFPLFITSRGKETLAGEILRLCADEEGMVEPWGNYPKVYNMTCKTRRDMLYRLCQLGLVHILRTGPRNGKRWHTTEYGDLHWSLLQRGHKVYRTCFLLMM